MTETAHKPEFVTEEGHGYDIFGKDAKLVDGRWLSFHGHLNLYRVELREANHAIVAEQPTLLRTQGMITKGGECRIWCNDFQIYRFEFTDTMLAISKLVQVLDRLQRFPVRLTNRSDADILEGRLIFFREIPAKILEFDGAQGRIRIRCVCGTGRFPVEPWQEDAEPDADIYVDLLDPRIWWFRKAEEQ
jgi:hypothetical protein